MINVRCNIKCNMAQDSMLVVPLVGRAPTTVGTLSRVRCHVLVASTLVALEAPGLVQHHHCTLTRFDNACDHPRARRGLDPLFFMETRVIFRNRGLFITPAVGVRGWGCLSHFNRRNACQGQDRTHTCLVLLSDPKPRIEHRTFAFSASRGTN